MPDLQHCAHNLDSRDEQIQHLESGLSRNLQVCNRWLASQLNKKAPVPSIRAVKECSENILQVLQMRVLLDLIQGRPASEQLLNHPLINPSSAPAPAAGRDATSRHNGNPGGTQSAPATALATQAPSNRSAPPAPIHVDPIKMKMALKVAQTAAQLATRTAESARKNTRR